MRAVPDACRPAATVALLRAARTNLVPAAAVTLAVLAAGCAGRRPPPEPGPGLGADVRPVPVGWTEEGRASWYGHPFHGRRTASGERYDMEGMTAAHRTLPFGAWVMVTNLDNGRAAVVRITDRGPFVEGRIIDLSRAAARQIGMLGPGTARVRLRVAALPEDAACHEVQVGAFRERERAVAVRDRFQEQGTPARLEDGPAETTRVLLGPYTDEETGRKVARRTRGFVRECPKAAGS